MLVPVNWMKEYIGIDETDRKIADEVTDTGSHVDSITYLADFLRKSEGIVVGKILDLSYSEDLKKLTICKVDIGEETVQILTGAKNMNKGDFVVVAKLGAILPGGKEIKKVEFDGFESFGMLCSYEELGFDDSIVPKKSKNGLAILGAGVKAGQDIIEALDLDQNVIEFEITPNRADCLSITGMAREVGAVFEKTLNLPDTNYEEKGGKIGDYLDSVEIRSDACSSFIARVIRNVKISQSPQWIQNKLMAAGMRPINNIVDISNFVMLEFGQPLHTYDLSAVKGKRVIVRKARDGEILKTLDESERKLDSDMLMIADEKDSMCIAGIMGGYDSEVREDTKDILLEAAVFNGANIRNTSKKLKLRSEASIRNEKGTNPIFAELASKRFCYLIDKIKAGEVCEGEIKAGATDLKVKNLQLRLSRTNLLLGMDFTKEEIIKYLESLEFGVKEIENKESSGLLFDVEVPFFRTDINIEADLIEEIARMYKIQNIPSIPLKLDTFPGKKSKIREFKDLANETLYALGLSEILTYSFISPKEYDKLNLAIDDSRRDAVEIINPLGEDFSVMRTCLIANMLETISKNLKNRIEDLRFFEIGNVFIKSENKLPNEDLSMVCSLSGNYDFYYLKDLFEKVCDKLGIRGLEFDIESEDPVFHSGRCARVHIGNEDLGMLGEVHPLVLDNFEMDKRVYAFEINLTSLYKFADKDKKYNKIIKYPAVKRDLSLVVDDEISSRDIEKTMYENGGDFLVDIELFDIYRGKQIENGKKSYTYKLEFVSPERTLKDEEIKSAFEKITKSLNEKYKVDLRG